MKSATLPALKKELQYRSQEQLIDFCLTMARFKLESKELLTYLVFESENEEAYIDSVKAYIDDTFDEINATNYYYIKKSVRKILRQVKRYIRYSKKKETEAFSSGKCLGSTDCFKSEQPSAFSLQRKVWG